MKVKILILVSAIGLIAGFGYFVYTYFGSMFNRDLNNPVFKFNMTRTAQMQLARVIKDVEEYKSHNGEYPRSLDFLLDNQVRATKPLDSLSNPYDILCTGTEKHGAHLQYDTLDNGESFYLFSVGLDLTPFTSDDIIIKAGNLKIESNYVERPMVP